MKCQCGGLGIRRARQGFPWLAGPCLGDAWAALTQHTMACPGQIRPCHGRITPCHILGAPCHAVVMRHTLRHGPAGVFWPVYPARLGAGHVCREARPGDARRPYHALALQGLNVGDVTTAPRDRMDPRGKRESKMGLNVAGDRCLTVACGYVGMASMEAPGRHQSGT